MSGESLFSLREYCCHNEHETMLYH